jgi:hypothetical protein
VLAIPRARLRQQARRHLQRVVCFDRNDKPVIGAERDWYGSSAGLGYRPYPVVTCPGEPGAPEGAIPTQVTADPANSPTMAFHQALIDTPPGVTLSDLTFWWEGVAYDGGQVAAIARSSLGPSPTEHLLAQ